MRTQYRQGDVLIERITELPAEVERRQAPVLFAGELTGHAHRLDPPGAATVLVAGDVLFLDVSAPGVRVLHEEHRPIDLPPGLYRAWRQREYSPRGSDGVRD